MTLTEPPVLSLSDVVLLHLMKKGVLVLELRPLPEAGDVCHFGCILSVKWPTEPSVEGKLGTDPKKGGGHPVAFQRDMGMRVFPALGDPSQVGRDTNRSPQPQPLSLCSNFPLLIMVPSQIHIAQGFWGRPACSSQLRAG